MRLKFTKMHGLGNDFMVIDLVTQHYTMNENTVRQSADRNFGIGFDQMLIVEPPGSPDVDFTYRIFNADGSEVEQCGNGARCFARFVKDKRLTSKSEIRVSTKSGIITLHLQANRDVTVDMGTPIVTPSEIPFEAASFATEYDIEANNHTYKIGAVSMGNPHGVLVVESTETADVDTLGPIFESHPRFPQRVNVGFMEIISRNEINLRVYERGAGETLACGTGACAAVVSGQLRGLLDPGVKVHLPGGSLFIDWQGEGQPVNMTGPATRVFEGQIYL